MCSSRGNVLSTMHSRTSPISGKRSGIWSVLHPTMAAKWWFASSLRSCGWTWTKYSNLVSSSLWNQMVSVAATEWFLSECHCASGPHSPWPGILSWDPCETDWSAGGGQCVASGRGVPVCLPVYLSATLLCTCTHRLHPRSNTRPPISLLVSADHSGGKVVSTNPVSETVVFLMRGQWLWDTGDLEKKNNKSHIWLPQ